MGFSQAQMAVENVQVVDELKLLIKNALDTENVDSFLHTMKRFGHRVRDFDGVLEDHILEQIPGAIASRPSKDLYAQLVPFDQGLVREFYLTAIEQVAAEWRRKYQKLYQYA